MWAMMLFGNEWWAHMRYPNTQTHHVKRERLGTRLIINQKSASVFLNVSIMRNAQLILIYHANHQSTSFIANHGNKPFWIITRR